MALASPGTPRASLQTQANRFYSLQPTGYLLELAISHASLTLFPLSPRLSHPMPRLAILLLLPLAAFLRVLSGALDALASRILLAIEHPDSITPG